MQQALIVYNNYYMLHIKELHSSLKNYYHLLKPICLVSKSNAESQKVTFYVSFKKFSKLI